MRKVFLTISGLVMFSLALGLPITVIAADVTFTNTNITLPNGKNLTVTDSAQLVTINDDSTMSVGLASDSDITFQSTEGWTMIVSPEITGYSCSGATSVLNLTSATTQTVTITLTDTKCTITPPGGGGGGGGLPPTPPTNASVVINADLVQTERISVILTLSATNAATMLIANESDFSDAGDWENYTTIKSWGLVAGEGTKTVYVKFRSSSGGEASAVSDTIELVAAAAPTTSDVSGGGGSVSLSDNKASVSLPAGAVSGSGTVSVTPTIDYIAPGSDKKVIGGQVYDFSVTVGEETVTSFNESVSLTFEYTDDEVAGVDESNLAIYYWDEDLGQWVKLGGTVDLTNNTITVQTDHFTKFAIFGQTTVTDGDLVKLVCPDGASVSDPCKAVYYLGNDGKRYVFPNEKTYSTWYDDFSSVKTISAADLASYMIGGNVTYRPGVKLVKITTDPKVYAVGKNGALRWLTTGAVAEAVYGAAWTSMVEDVPDSFFVNYMDGADIESTDDYDKTVVQEASPNINTDKGL